MAGELAEKIPETLLTSYTGMQRYIMEKLESKGAGLEDILDDLINIRNTALRPTPTGEMVEDPVARMSANKLLLELMGIYKTKGGMNVNFNISDLLYAPRGPQIQPAGEVIQGGS